MADPTNRLIEHFADGELQTIPAAYIAHHGQTVAVRCPLGPLHLVENLAGRHAGQRATVNPRSDLTAAEQDGHLSGGRDSKDVSAGKPERTRCGAAHTGREYFGRISSPGRAISDCLAVGSEPRYPNHTPSESE